jgi:hypothetical protein
VELNPTTSMSPCLVNIRQRASRKSRFSAAMYTRDLTSTSSLADARGASSAGRGLAHAFPERIHFAGQFLSKLGSGASLYSWWAFLSRSLLLSDKCTSPRELAFADGNQLLQFHSRTSFSPSPSSSRISPIVPIS